MDYADISLGSYYGKAGELKLILSSINPFAPEPPVTARADPGPFYPLWRHQF